MNGKIEVEEAVSRIVASYASRLDVGPDEIVNLYLRLRDELAQTGETGAATAPASAVRTNQAAVPIAQAVSEDKVTCLCCGRSFKMLKRHIGAEHGMTEASYRAAFGLPEEFPLVAPSYSRKKAAHARQAGLGRYDRSIIPDEA